MGHNLIPEVSHPKYEASPPPPPPPLTLSLMAVYIASWGPSTEN